MRTLLSTLLTLSLALFAGAAAAETPMLDGKAMPAYTSPEGGLQAEIKARGKLVGGVEAQNPPFEFIEGGRIVGFDIELSELFAESLGVTFEPVDTAWSGVIPSLYTGRFDMIWSAMTVTEPRKEAVTFSQPYASDQAELIVRAGDDRIRTIADLNGKILATQLNSAAEHQAKELIAAHGLDTKIRAFDHFDGAYLDLVNGNVDVVTSTKLNDRVLFEKMPGAFAVAIELPIFNYVAVATRKQDTEFSARIDAFLSELKASGKLAELQTKWFGYAMTLPGGE
jgi:polar amino acid transport system substrate-binding protein